MDALASGAQVPGEVRLDGGVAVLHVGRDGEGALLGEVGDAPEAPHQRDGVGLGDEARGGEHPGVGGAAQGVPGQEGQVGLGILAHGEAVDGRIQRDVLGPEGGGFRPHGCTCILKNAGTSLA